MRSIAESTSDGPDRLSTIIWTPDGYGSSIVGSCRTVCAIGVHLRHNICSIMNWISRR